MRCDLPALGSRDAGSAGIPTLCVSYSVPSTHRPSLLRCRAFLSSVDVNAGEEFHSRHTPHPGESAYPLSDESHPFAQVGLRPLCALPEDPLLEIDLQAPDVPGEDEERRRQEIGRLDRPDAGIALQVGFPAFLVF